MIMPFAPIFVNSSMIRLTSRRWAMALTATQPALLSGASVGIIGTTVGFILGLAFTQNIETIRQWIEGLTGTELFAAEIYFLSRLPAVADPAEVASVVLMGLGLSFLATLYPSWRAARIDPAEALRYE